MRQSNLHKASNSLKRSIIRAVEIVPPLKHRRHCNICGQDSVLFRRWGIKSPVHRKLRIIGSGVRNNCVCPHCKSHDRFRWCYYLIEHHTDILTANRTVLHIAPEPQIAKRLEKLPNCEYITGDIAPEVAQMVVDVTDMPFEDGCFDYIIMNHMLEHIPDEKKAMDELERCLKPNGTLILSFPMSDSPIIVEEGVVGGPLSPQERLERFGQSDHCRLYGWNAPKRLAGYGLKVTPYVVHEQLSRKESKRLGLMEEDIVFFCKLMA